MRKTLDIAGCEPESAPEGQLASIIKSDTALWAKVVKDAGITAIEVEADPRATALPCSPSA